MAEQFDAVVVGAGFAGMYMLHRLRGLGMRAVVLEAGGDVGGTWYWNRYPGARCDVESVQYSYQFDADLQQEWTWTERYAAQPEIPAYANHVADRFGLRRDIRFDTRVKAAAFDEAEARWELETEAGERFRARWCVMALGCLSAANLPDFEGRDSFEGPTYHTGRWPHEGVDLAGKRVAVIGTGSSAIQSIPVLAREARHLTVFQRTANYSIPAHNRPLPPDFVAEVKAHYPELRARARSMPSGIDLDYRPLSALETPEEEREAEFERRWAHGGLSFLGCFADLLFKEDANRTAADFVRAKIADIVDDPETARLLAPTNIIGCKRLCVDTGYYATFNRPNVELVDVSERPVEAITPGGVRAHGREWPADAIVFATGFDAMTGALERIDIRGAGGRRLRDAWEEGPRTYLGPHGRRLPQPLHRDRPRQPLGADEHAPLHRAACGLDRRLPCRNERPGRTADGGGARGPGRLGGACGRDGLALAALHLFELVYRRQRTRQAARLHALYRRPAGLHREMRRRGRGRL